MRIAVGVVGFAMILTACERKTPEHRPETAAPGAGAAGEAVQVPMPEPAPMPVEAVPDPGSGVTVEMGLRLGAGQRAEETVLSFAPGDPVCVSVTLPEGRSGGQAAVAWYSSHEGHDTELGRVEGAFAGSPARVGWCLPGGESLALGSYRLEIAVDGQEAASSQITITEARELLRSTGS